MTKYLAIYGKPRYLGIIETDKELEKGLTVVVDSHRGEEYAVVAGALSEEQEKGYRRMRNTTEHGEGGLKNGGEPLVSDLKFLLVPTKEELDETADYAQDELNILLDSRDILAEHKLEMKMIDVEFIRKRRKLFFYFSAEQRVDFRAYVRDLAHAFKTRIELRQIGVRDEAKIIRGVAPCGNPCCCSYWLNQFAPINIRMVKEQTLALNPAKISGICGRLMCCIHFEHNVYHEMWQGLPNSGSKLKTPSGNIIVAGIDLAAGSVRCFMPGRGEVRVPVKEFPQFKETVMAGKEWTVAVIEEPKKIKFEVLSLSQELEEKARAERTGGTVFRRDAGKDTAEQEGTTKKRRRKRSRSQKPAGEANAQAAPAQQPPRPRKTETAAAPEAEGDEAKRKRRRRRGGRNRKKPDAPATE